MSNNETKRGGMILSIKIDVMRIDREILFAGKNGAKYLDMTAFIDNEKGEYGDNGMVVQDVGKDRRESGEKGAILGNCRIIKGEVAGKRERQPQAQAMNEQARDAQRQAKPQAMAYDDTGSEIPF